MMMEDDPSEFSNEEENMEDEDFSLQIANESDMEKSEVSADEEVKPQKKQKSTKKRKSSRKSKKSDKKEVKVTIKLGEMDTTIASSSIPKVESEHENDEEAAEEPTEQKKKRRARKPRNTMVVDPNIPPDAQLPVKFGTSQVVSLGRIEYNNPNYHNDRYIFPIGYKAEKNYMSYKTPGAKAIYTCEILQGDDAPIFKITPSDDTISYTSSTPSGAWSAVIKTVQESKNKSMKTCTVSGPEYFGLSNSKVRHLIELLPDAEKCTHYKRKFVNPEEDNEPQSAKKRGRKKKEDKAEDSSTTKRKRSSKKAQDDSDEENDKENEESKTKKRKSNPVKSEETENEEDEESDEEPSDVLIFKDPLFTDEGIPDAVSKIYREGLPFLRKYQHTNYTDNITSFNGHNEFIYLKYNCYTQSEVQEFVKDCSNAVKQAQMELLPEETSRKKDADKEKFQVEKYEKSETRSPKEILNSMWELAYVFTSLEYLRPVLKIAEFDYDEFEDALLHPELCNGLMADLIIRLIKGPALDRKSHALLDPASIRWKTVLKNKIDSLQSNYRLWQVSPLLLTTYDELSPQWRLILLKALMDWKFDTNQRVIDYSRNHYGLSMLFEPISKDEKGVKYWYFGDHIGRLYVEHPPSSKSNGSWKLKCSSVAEFEKFLEELKSETENSPSETKTSLIEYIETVIRNLKNNEDTRSIEQKREDRENMLVRRAREREEEDKELQKQHELETKALLEEIEYEKEEAPLADQNAADGSEANDVHTTKLRSGRAVKNINFSVFGEEEADGEAADEKRSLRPRRKKSYKEAVEDDDKRNKDDEEFVLDENDDDDEEEYDNEDDDEDFSSEEEEEEYMDKKKRTASKPKAGAASSSQPNVQQQKKPTPQQNMRMQFNNVSGVHLSGIGMNMMQPSVNNPMALNAQRNALTVNQNAKRGQPQQPTNTHVSNRPVPQNNVNNMLRAQQLSQIQRQLQSGAITPQQLLQLQQGQQTGYRMPNQLPQQPQQQQPQQLLGLTQQQLAILMKLQEHQRNASSIQSSAPNNLPQANTPTVGMPQANPFVSALQLTKMMGDNNAAVGNGSASMQRPPQQQPVQVVQPTTSQPLPPQHTQQQNLLLQLLQQRQGMINNQPGNLANLQSLLLQQQRGQQQSATMPVQPQPPMPVQPVLQPIQPVVQPQQQAAQQPQQSQQSDNLDDLFFGEDSFT
ncbi:hypothetical protein C9374_009575 [Naegleria lovaniensis]|uniref:Uncharacterized protein n=1 Tax=Naegleria lovaniensis TaxID=51637 RepID=A0AA88H1N2_NAELO|nr:uncharacterized protein C9374_009575 [Naegleria lovaniensis]KAG2392998.1 hypothetical protein C9374_009575 [Naegleria lovaniensis]